MSNSRISRLIVGAAILVVWALAAAKLTRAEMKNFIPVDITGVQHMGANFNVPEFYVDGAWGSNVGREGGGGSSVCCVVLPRKWREGITVEIRWSVTDWGKENVKETDIGNYSSLITEGTYKAKVPLEKFSAPGDLYVHFFRNGKVRVLSSQTYPENSAHPIQYGDEHAAELATKGERIREMFTAEELSQMGSKK